MKELEKLGKLTNIPKVATLTEIKTQLEEIEKKLEPKEQEKSEEQKQPEEQKQSEEQPPPQQPQASDTSASSKVKFWRKETDPSRPKGYFKVNEKVRIVSLNKHFTIYSTKRVRSGSSVLIRITTSSWNWISPRTVIKSPKPRTV